MSNDISVFPVALLENAVTRPIAYQGEEVCGHLSDEPRRCTFPMNCLYSTCRLTLIPDGLSATLPLSVREGFPVILPHSEASSKPRFRSNRGLRSREIQQHHMRELLRPFEDNFTSVWRDVEVANVEVGSDVGQLALCTRLQVDEP
jgi:hypothetical protein